MKRAIAAVALAVMLASCSTSVDSGRYDETRCKQERVHKFLGITTSKSQNIVTCS